MLYEYANNTNAVLLQAMMSDMPDLKKLNVTGGEQNQNTLNRLGPIPSNATPWRVSLPLENPQSFPCPSQI